MGHLTVVGGIAKPPFAMNSHGIAQYKLATHYGARRIIESYAFPDASKPRIITPSPAKDLLYDYYRKGCREDLLARAIESAARPVANVSQHEKGRRGSILRAAKHLKDFGATLCFDDVRKRAFQTVISGLAVRVSLDFLATVTNKNCPQRIGVIFNVAAEIADHADRLKVHADIETEIALLVLRHHIPTIAAVWYVDLLGEKVVKRRVASSGPTWREVTTICDDVMIAYRTLVARNSRGNLRAT